MHDIVNMQPVSRVDLELRLADVLRKVLARVTWLTDWTVQRHSSPGWDLIATGSLAEGRRALLCVECKLHFQPSQFSLLAGRRCIGESSASTSRVLGMPFVSPRMAALCEQHGWSWFDLAGNCRLDIPGSLLIERSGNEPVRVNRTTGANLSSPEAARVIRALLAPENAGRRWTQRDIVNHFSALTPKVTAPSLALVNKVVQHLREQAFLEPLPMRGFVVRDYEGLLQAWRQAWRFDASLRRRYFTLLHGRVLGERLRSLETWASGRVAYAVFSAADVQAPHVRQSRTWLYLAGDLEQDLSEMIEAKPVDSGENLLILIPNDSGVFYHLDTGRDRLPCTNPVQTYVDLVNAGGRGEEAADAVLQQRLKPGWSEARNDR